QHDCVFVERDPMLTGMQGLDVVRILLFFSFIFQDVLYPCALVHWFSKVQEEPDNLTSMWMVRPDFNEDLSPTTEVIHLDCILQATHLLPVFGDDRIPRQILFHNSLDAFASFYVNKFIDHHAFGLAS
ncbi:hypothetical protein SERLA73DRAFT_57755, partial [Serpula lacrymans var. lacrymans S7.3]